MAENNNANNNGNAKNDNIKQREQDVPLYSSIKIIVGRTVALILKSGGLLMLLSTIFFAYDYYNGVRGYDRSIETYKETLDNVRFMGGWFDIREAFTSIVNSGQDMILKAINWVNEANQSAGMTHLKSNFSKYTENIIDAYDGGEIAEKGFFLGSWNGVVEFFSYYLMDTLLTILTFVLKILIIFNFLPVYFLVMIPALANGYTGRKIATFTGELDKEDRVELAYSKLRLFSITVVYFFVGIPHSYNPLYFLVPSAILTAVAVKYLARYYKKYW